MEGDFGAEGLFDIHQYAAVRRASSSGGAQQTPSSEKGEDASWNEGDASLDNGAEGTWNDEPAEDVATLSEDGELREVEEASFFVDKEGNADVQPAAPVVWSWGTGKNDPWKENQNVQRGEQPRGRGKATRTRAEVFLESVAKAKQGSRERMSVANKYS